jgi:hypothetical protein
MVASLMLAAAACTDGSLGGSGTGTTKIYLTDDPFPFDSILRVDIYVAKIEASTSLDTTQAGGQNWVTVAEPQRVFNLLDFQQGTAALAGEAVIPAGAYRAIRVTINTSLSHLISAANTEVPVIWPVPGELVLNAYVEHSLDVAESGAQIVIDFDVGRTFFSAQPRGGFFFIPWIRAVNNAATGSIAGVVTGPDIEGHQTALGNVSVMVWTNPFPGTAGAIVGTGRTDASGHYVIAYLSPGAYGVGVQPPGYYGFNAATASVQVTSGHQATTNFGLTRDTTGGGGGPDTSTVTPGGPVASIALQFGTPSGSPVTQVCDSVPMMVELRNAQGQILLGRAVSWRVSDSTVLALEGVFGQYAHLRALKAGASALTATSEGKSASLSFTVVGSGSCGTGGGGNTNPVAIVTINPATITASLPALDSVFASAVLKDAGGLALSGRTVTWTIADTTVMVISGVYGQSVLLRAKRVGTTTLTAVSEGKQAVAAVVVQ